MDLAYHLVASLCLKFAALRDQFNQCDLIDQAIRFNFKNVLEQMANARYLSLHWQGLF
ncbi:hypothetical protein [Spirosoma foliorum]|uniref:Uncharacterized protein n=1 Tax=Spirosoma foliorum TaxID=2710596 RepID=A0A7G5H093_9BACT|nr:hypothetical protein [Spirosoma foliorum]QMW04535.1 hypothetical protein H3H32_06230 [Spirosoma foliorum]